MSLSPKDVEFQSDASSNFGDDESNVLAVWAIDPPVDANYAMSLRNLAILNFS